jgi:hypothetical protein
MLMPMSMSIPANNELGQLRCSKGTGRNTIREKSAMARQFSAISSQFSATAFWLLPSDF